MSRLFKSALFAALFSLPPAWASNALPDIGTAAVSALSIDKEISYGQAYIKLIRASSNMANDPVLSEYVQNLGQRLVAHAEHVRMPFHFFLVRNSDINAAAFLGAYIKVHTGLLLHAKTESELASVLAHEIAHVTQRHIARSIENQANSQNLTLAGMLGSVLLAVANPVAGLAALQTTVAANVQSGINYTRANEFEADRIGLQILARAGFDPQGMGAFFVTLSDRYRYATTPPEMLITHPLPDTRISEARARANQYPERFFAPSLDFQLARARVQVRHGAMDGETALSYFEQQLQQKRYRLFDGALYGKALALLETKQHQEAKALLLELEARHPHNLFILDALTDADLALKQSDSALTRLAQAQQRYPNNHVIVLNQAYALERSTRFDEAANLLQRYLRTNNDDALAWQSLSRVEGKRGELLQSHWAQAEYRALHSDYTRAIDELSTARSHSTDELDNARLEARIEQLKAEELALKKLR